MKDNSFFDLKFLNKYYIKLKENELKKLELKKIELTEAAEAEESKIQDNKIQLERLQNENLILKEQYGRLNNILIARGIILNIEKNNYDIKQWDNLYLNRRGVKYIITSKKGEELYALDKDISLILDEIFKDGYGCSIIVVRVTVKLLKIQLRFIK